MQNRTSLLYLLILLCLAACSDSKPQTEQALEQKTGIPTTSKSLDASNEYINSNGESIRKRFTLPDSFHREILDENSFAYYLQNFPLQPHGTQVHLYDGSAKYTQNYHSAVLDIDTGTRNLQQCADAIMRLRAEYLYAKERYDDIQFHFTNGFLVEYRRWKAGERISVKGNKSSWYKSGPKDTSYPSFRKYMNMIFTYAGTLSLDKELNSKSLKDLSIGDVFIQGGSPGHAVLVVDVAVNESNGEKIFLIAQSYMPAQDIHIIKNNKDMKYGPWYSINEIQNGLTTPEWSFTPEDLKSF